MDAPEDDGFQGPSGFSPIPRTVGDYQLVSRVGGGSMAELYIGRKVSQYGFVHRAVIKQVKRSRSDFRQLQGMLLDEARATACFDHPNLVKIYDVGEVENGLYLALEYVEGTDLRRVNQKLRSRKEALPFELACYIVSEVLRGVHHAHTAQGPDGQHLEIVHRDVNPSNVLVANSGHVKLADFGVVRMRERIQPKTEPGLLKGKYAYLAPEYIAGEACSVQTDVYAAGIMLFELLSGRECFTGSTAYEVMWKIVNKGVPMYRLQREGVPEDLQRLVARATSMVPERRYASAQDMANALEAWLMRSQKHATPWVLSVFFHRHDLFRQPL
ncbi:MAG: serine/threonine-protein kinase, partial [Myxococcota bacterium]